MMPPDSLHWPWDNPKLRPGLYTAEIVELRHDTYGDDASPCLRFVFWLPVERVYFTTNIYLPKSKPDNRSVYRLAGLCRSVGRVPQDALDWPKWFQGDSLQIEVIEVEASEDNGGRRHCDVVRFCSADAVLPPEVEHA